MLSFSVTNGAKKWSKKMEQNKRRKNGAKKWSKIKGEKVEQKNGAKKNGKNIRNVPRIAKRLSPVSLLIVRTQ